MSRLSYQLSNQVELMVSIVTIFYDMLDTAAWPINPSKIFPSCTVLLQLQRFGDSMVLGGTARDDLVGRFSCLAL
jgi:hypothetical protein